MKKTLKEIIDIVDVIEQLYKKDPELEHTKFGYAVKRFMKDNYQEYFDNFRDQLEMIRIEHALTDEKTAAVITDKDNIRGFKYSKDQFKAVREAEKKFEKEWKDQEIDVKVYVSTFVPEMTEYQREVLEGILI